MKPSTAGFAKFKLLDRQLDLHQYVITSFIGNIHGMILNITWDNGIKSAYYLGKDGDLLVDDGSTGTWGYNIESKTLNLDVYKVGVFSFNLSNKDGSPTSRYYWDNPLNLCRDILAGRPVCDYQCQ